MNVDPQAIRRRIKVALGHEPGDLLIKGGCVVNVFNRRVEPADVVIADGYIAGVGCYSWQASQSISAEGQVLIPGLIDAHIHLESTLLSPAELARLVVPMATTAVICDAHEIGNVLGVRGIDMLAAAGAGVPLDLFYMASPCVPATEWEDSGARIGAADLKALFERPAVLGLAEVMDVPAVLAGDRDILAKLTTALEARAPIDGHAPALWAESSSRTLRPEFARTTSRRPSKRRVPSLPWECSCRCAKARARRISTRSCLFSPAVRSTTCGASRRMTSFRTTSSEAAICQDSCAGWLPEASHRPSR